MSIINNLINKQSIAKYQEEEKNQLKWLYQENEKNQIKWLDNPPNQPKKPNSEILKELGYRIPNIKQPKKINAQFSINSALHNGNTSAVQKILKDTKKIRSGNPRQFYETKREITPMSFTNKNNYSKQKKMDEQRMNIYNPQMRINNPQMSINNPQKNFINFSNNNYRKLEQKKNNRKLEQLEQLEQQEDMFNKFLKVLKKTGKIGADEFTSLVRKADGLVGELRTKLTSPKSN